MALLNAPPRTPTLLIPRAERSHPVVWVTRLSHEGIKLELQWRAPKRGPGMATEPFCVGPSQRSVSHPDGVADRTGPP
ncbi:unnamed protein product [Lota lota]